MQLRSTSIVSSVVTRAKEGTKKTGNTRTYFVGTFKVKDLGTIPPIAQLWVNFSNRMWAWGISNQISDMDEKTRSKPCQEPQHNHIRIRAGATADLFRGPGGPYLLADLVPRHHTRFTVQLQISRQVQFYWCAAIREVALATRFFLQLPARRCAPRFSKTAKCPFLERQFKVYNASRCFAA